MGTQPKTRMDKRGKGNFINYENMLIHLVQRKKPTIDVGLFSGNLKLDELINWINELEEYFEYEDIEDPDRVNFEKVKLKGHAKIW